MSDVQLTHAQVLVNTVVSTLLYNIQVHTAWFNKAIYQSNT